MRLVANNTDVPLELYVVAVIQNGRAAQLLDKILPCKQMWVYGFQSVLAVDSQGNDRALRLVRALSLVHLHPQTRWLGSQLLITKQLGGNLSCCCASVW